MRKKVLIFISCIIIIAIMGCSTEKTENISDVRLETYNQILTEYEHALKDADYIEEKWVYVYDYIKRYLDDPTVNFFYSINDLAKDGTPELILSVQDKGEYIPFIIYAYDGKKAKWLCIREEYIMKIYEGGIIEYITGGVRTHFFYDKIEKDSITTLRLADIVMDIQDENKFHYYKEVEKEKYEEISEEEFIKIKNQYTKDEIDIEWVRLEGFWEK